MGARPSRTTQYVCEYCGHEGNTEQPVDQVQCLMCGEPVTPVGPH